MGRPKNSRDARQFPEPIAVWYCNDWSGRAWGSNRVIPIRVRPAILIEWRQWSKEWGVHRPRREALCVLVDGGGERPPSVTLRWVDAGCLRPVDVTTPHERS